MDMCLSINHYMFWSAIYGPANFLPIFEVEFHHIDQYIIFQKTKQLIQFMGANFLIPIIQYCVANMNKKMRNE